ncbi:MAG TPA: hypothetical protein VFP65_27665 [Anaeromyxobacteraceae bacterium]|nr:hypothetical protein [Anaeromyxobacteraceae bacterium]
MTAALLALALSAVSTSKIGVVVLGDDPTSQTILGACPATVVAPLTATSSFGAALTTYRSACTGGTIVARLDAAFINTGNPGVDAVNYWITGLILVNGMGVRPDWVEGPAGVTYATPALHATFWTTLADQISGSTFQPIVGRLDPTTPASDFCPTATALAAKLYTWGWSWLARTSTFTQNPTTEATTTLGYRTVSSTCTALAGKPLFLTEAGPTAVPWPAGDVSWLAWLDGQVQSEAQAAAAFEAGGAVAPTLAPVAAALAAYLQNPQPPDAGSPDGGADGGTSGAIGGGTPGAPDGPPGPGPSSTCSSSGPGIGLLALVPVLALLRRRRAR